MAQIRPLASHQATAPSEEDGSYESAPLPLPAAPVIMAPSLGDVDESGVDVPLILERMRREVRESAQIIIYLQKTIQRSPWRGGLDWHDYPNRHANGLKKLFKPFVSDADLLPQTAPLQLCLVGVGTGGAVCPPSIGWAKTQAVHGRPLRDCCPPNG